MKPLVSALILVTMIVSLSGCVEQRIRDLEYRQLNAELEEVRRAKEFLSSGPQLGAEYDGRVFLSENAINKVLAGLTGIEHTLERPQGTKLLINTAKMDFRDGAVGLLFEATAVHRCGDLSVNMLIRADLLTQVDPEKSLLILRPQIKEVIPTVKVSIFEWRLFWYVQLLLRIEAQKLVDAAPAMEVELNPVLEVDLPRQTREEQFETDDGYIFVKFATPGFSEKFDYKVSNFVHLEEGVYLFFKLERD